MMTKSRIQDRLKKFVCLWVEGLHLLVWRRGEKSIPLFKQFASCSFCPCAVAATCLHGSLVEHFVLRQSPRMEALSALMFLAVRNVSSLFIFILKVLIGRLAGSDKQHRSMDGYARLKANVWYPIGLIWKYMKWDLSIRTCGRKSRVPSAPNIGSCRTGPRCRRACWRRISSLVPSRSPQIWAEVDLQSRRVIRFGEIYHVYFCNNYTDPKWPPHPTMPRLFPKHCVPYAKRCFTVTCPPTFTRCLVLIFKPRIA